MGYYLNIGNDGFTTVRKGHYVDKTGLIEFVNSTLGTANKLTCVTRPRRFGKSFAAKMLCAYYDKSCNSRGLFQDLSISDDPDFERYLNQYNVIYLDITLFISRAADVKDVVRNMNEQVMAEVAETFCDVPKGADLAESLVGIAKATGQKFIMIIDEWDALFREARDDIKLQKEYISFLRSLFKSSWTDMIFDGVYITGILPIKKYGTQSAMTDFKEYSMTQPEPLEAFVGFTEGEVRSLCVGSDIPFEDIRRWYDGYVLGAGTHIYSPESVMEAIRRKRIGNYWTQSETYESLRIYIEINEDGLKVTQCKASFYANIRVLFCFSIGNCSAITYSTKI